jgi:hypothetical protein
MRPQVVATDTNEVPWIAYRSYEPMPPRKTVSFRYSAVKTLTSGASGLFGSEALFRPNSLYDPDLGSTGHQPYGFDQMAAFYNRYRVTSFDIELIFTDPSADGIFYAATVQPSSETFTIVGKDVEAMSEQPLTVVGQLNNTGSQRCVARRRFSVAEVEGLRPAEFIGNITDYSAPVTSNPTNTPYLRIAAAQPGAGGSADVRVAINIVMHAELYLRKVLAQS